MANIHVISFLRYLIRQKHENKAVIYKIYNKTLNWLEAHFDVISSGETFDPQPRLIFSLEKYLTVISRNGFWSRDRNFRVYTRKFRVKIVFA